jgi:uncharacterized RDD family membrane protein YckC/putative lipoic acid-binding regulatory protein
MSSSYSHQDWAEALNAPTSLKELKELKELEAQLEAEAPPEEDSDESQSHRLRVDIITRLFAFFLDIAIVAGLSSALMVLVSIFFDSVLRTYGFKLSGGMLMIPVSLLYVSYFSSEATQGSSLGKRLLGVELRRANGDKASGSTLLRRAFLKHLGTMLIVPAVILQTPGMILLAWVGCAWYVLNTFTAVSASRQSLIDRLTELAVYPRSLPKTNLARLAGKARTDKEIRAELIKAQRAKQQKSAKGQKKSKTPPAEAFPCGAEIKVYARPREGLEEEILDCFARFIQNVYPDQIKEFPPKGSYSSYKVVMRFSSPLEMEASYEALARVPGVVTILPLKLVRLPKQSAGGWLKRPARPVVNEAPVEAALDDEVPLV